nr:AP-3 complex subunit sigma [Oryza sativa Japonica Group]
MFRFYPHSPSPPIFAHPTSAGSISPPKTNSSLAPEKHQELVRAVFQLLSARPDSVSNFVKVDAIFGPGAKLIYKHLATLYLGFVFDGSENELAVLDLVQGNLAHYY